MPPRNWSRFLIVLFALSCAPVFAAPYVPAHPPATGVLRVGANAVPHGEMLKALIPELKAQGITLDIRIFPDYGRANIAVARGELDANFFQTEPYLWRWRAAHGAPLVVVGRVHVEPMGIYSRVIRSAAEFAKLQPNGTVALPRDPANQGRALRLLQSAGLIRVDDRYGLDAQVADITENPHKLHFRTVEAFQVAGQLGSATLVVLNGNFALEAKLAPEQALARETGDSPFPNVVVVREDRTQDQRVQALVAALRGPSARKVLQEKFAGAAVLAE